MQHIAHVASIELKIAMPYMDVNVVKFMAVCTLYVIPNMEELSSITLYVFHCTHYSTYVLFRITCSSSPVGESVSSLWYCNSST